MGLGTELEVQIWKLAFPGIDVEGELLKMQVWLEANPARRKKNMRRFIVNWLSKSHRGLQALLVTRSTEGSKQEYTPSQREEWQQRNQAENESYLAEMVKKYPELA